MLPVNSFKKLPAIFTQKERIWKHSFQLKFEFFQLLSFQMELERNWAVLPLGSDKSICKKENWKIG